MTLSTWMLFSYFQFNTFNKTNLTPVLTSILHSLSRWVPPAPSQESQHRELILYPISPSQFLSVLSPEHLSVLSPHPHFQHHHMTSSPIFPIPCARFIFLIGLLDSLSAPCPHSVHSVTRMVFLKFKISTTLLLKIFNAAPSIQNKAPRKDLQNPSKFDPCLNL